MNILSLDIRPHKYVQQFSMNLIDREKRTEVREKKRERRQKEGDRERYFSLTFTKFLFYKLKETFKVSTHQFFIIIDEIQRRGEKEQD